MKTPKVSMVVKFVIRFVTRNLFKIVVIVLLVFVALALSMIVAQLDDLTTINREIKDHIEYIFPKEIPLPSPEPQAENRLSRRLLYD